MWSLLEFEIVYGSYVGTRNTAPGDVIVLSAPPYKGIIFVFRQRVRRRIGD